MLIIRGPGGFQGGKALDALVSHIDIFPTVMDLIGAERPDYVQGESLLPLVNGEKDEIRETIFGEKNYHVAYEPERSARTHRYKYLRRFDKNHPKPVLANIDDGPSKHVLLQNGWGGRPLPEERLFDLLYDPQEMHNVAYEPDYADTLSLMQARLQTWMIETNEPILKGPVPAPKGAQLHTPDPISPQEPTITV
jgi:N-sulfoglucosamine sulfohydrolase